VNLALVSWLWRAQLRAQPGRIAVASIAIAVGVGLALAIHLVNRSALAEFDAALSSINGQAQYRLEGRAGYLDEAIWPQIAAHPAVASASAVIETSQRVWPVARAGDAGSQQADRQPTRMRIIGIDPMRAARITPDLLASTADGETGEALFDSDSIFLSKRALELLGLQPGDSVDVAAGIETVRFRIAGTLARVAHDIPVAVMDIGTLQWRLGWLDRLSRIDLRLTPGESAQRILGDESLRLPPGVILSRPEDSRQRMSNLSRAYRVNLGLLALVALFTGAFIVHSTMSLAIAREQSRFALMRILGADRTSVGLVLFSLGSIPGVVGSAIGCAAGAFGAWLILGLMGGDLGAGFFTGGAARLSIDAATLISFAAAGVVTALAGTFAPARRILSQPSARALKAGSVEDLLPVLRGQAWPVVLFLSGAALLTLPPIDDLPLPSYATIALWLVAGILLLPRLIGITGRLSRLTGTWGAGPDAWLAIHRVAASPGSHAAALGGVVAAVAFAAAMAIMVTSFRTSVDQWLEAVLPADVYGRIEPSAPGTGIPPDIQQRIIALPGVTRAEFLLSGKLLLDARRPAVSLLAREIDPERPQDRLPLTGGLSRPPAGTIPVWVSEAVVDLYGWRPGQQVALPLDGAAGHRFHVSGVWRDYARQHGAIVISRSDWQALTGELHASDFSVWLDAQTEPEALIASIRDLFAPATAVELRSARDLRAISLRIFDRSFAATWALETVAILVALFGVAASWAAESIVRRKEFGMLMHLGVERREIQRQFAMEALLIVGPAVLWSIGLGIAIAGILVWRVNPQSFHWTMDLSLPISALVTGALTMMGLAASVAWACAAGTGPVEMLRAVREES
jgi:putative ABC transport system permease protein